MTEEMYTANLIGDMFSPKVPCVPVMSNAGIDISNIAIHPMNNDPSDDTPTLSETPTTSQRSSTSITTQPALASIDDRSPSLMPLGRIDTSVRFQDTDAEGRPSIYLFIFVNPLSGDRKGSDLIHLPIQHFRLRRLPRVQVEIHNILDSVDRKAGLERIQLIENMIKLQQLPALPTDEDMLEEKQRNGGALSKTARTRHIHVWSAGGDGTVMSVFEMLVAHRVDMNCLFFSCIPFGTGNDFSQVLGWGRTIPHSDVLGRRLAHLEELVTERLEKAEAARLDIWQVEMTAHPSGYVRLAGPHRQDGHDVAEIKDDREYSNNPRLERKMCNYMSIGVQGYVGSGFEEHRAGNRFANVMVYTKESAKWVFLRKFPPVTHFIDSILDRDGEPVLRCPDPRKKSDSKTSRRAAAVHCAKSSSTNHTPEMTKHPIDFVIQNIPHIWGREVDLWGEAKYGLESVRNRSGATHPDNWRPQLANDGRMEVMVINDLLSYFKKLANIRQHVSRIGQFETPFTVRFRPPPENNQKQKGLWSWIKRRLTNRYERENIICIMCDGEFYVLKDPKELKFERYAQIWTLGRSDEKRKGRLVLDELAKHQQEDHPFPSMQ
ncbi:ATP-NAD kinase-like domain-containing protein [Radiomyces spectabilis]|uniref:ATP-NAD kinase-like domain-containing protein n=1 Tax=Radiomyces spectabilis TaxID=64574 RepID=UPI002220C9DE|nr:ATP-NAD kinase-like domain-containing protein [Radiomyces spectabilis]KAI8364352.1 ATP-NAD kinase-like domain-containing protein [Radiomyces spectabilis]